MCSGQPQLSWQPSTVAHEHEGVAISPACCHVWITCSTSGLGQAWAPRACPPWWPQLTCRPCLGHYKPVNRGASSTWLFINSLSGGAQTQHCRQPASTAAPQANAALWCSLGVSSGREQRTTGTDRQRFGCILLSSSVTRSPVSS